jgi:nitrite reductase/ring-hydroxylating ferredoxin subunit
MALETTDQPAAEQGAEQTALCCGSSRRALLRAAGVGGAAAAVALTAAACGSSSGGSTAGGSGGSALAQASEIPVGGGKIVSADGGTVITQPASGTFKAFTAVCTHQFCTVGSVSDNQITCPCHGSVFSAKDGSVLQGPARAPLAAKNINVSGGQIFLS